MHVRFNYITADPLRLGDSVRYIETEVRPQVDSQPGSLGTALYMSTDWGVAILESFWVSGDALAASEHAVSPGRREAVKRATGTVSVERYQVPVFEIERRLTESAKLRLTRLDVKPDRVPDAVEAYGDTVVPWLAEIEGFCSTLLFVDPARGHSISESIWRNSEALAGSRSIAAAMRVDTVAATDGVVRAVEEYDLVSSSARKA